MYRENRWGIVGTIVKSYVSLNNIGTNESPAIWEALVNVWGLSAATESRVEIAA